MSNTPSENGFNTPPPEESPEETQELSTAHFQSGDLEKIFKVIDELRACGVSEDISLPQLVVVGDQSSGKSSVLEALTNIPFPVAGKLCTRFATQINFRRDVVDSVRVSIMPAVDSGDAEKRTLGNFERRVAKLDAGTFQTILSEASEAMGLPKPGEEITVSTGGKSRFSNNVLKLELAGPAHVPFSVVDVPGLFQSATTFQTDEDAEVVEALVKRYIKESRTIILAVASALHETANQKVFRLAKDADPKGIRTVGLLTKPDAVQLGDEAHVLDVANNKITVLTHGWFVVRNRSPREVEMGITAEQRAGNEKRFFATPPWNTLDKNHVGCKALLKFLQRLLVDHVKKEYPALLKELETLLSGCREELEELGPARETAAEQRSALVRYSTKFQETARDALMGLYQTEHLRSEEMRLRNNIRKLTDKFAEDVCEEGGLWDFDDEDETDDVLEWIKEEQQRSRGTELDGMFNADVLRSLFLEQTEKWEDLARNHIILIQEETEKFIAKLLEMKCSDPQLRGRILDTLCPFFDKTNSAAQEELQKILRSERGDVLLTYDANYRSSFETARQERALESIGGSGNDIAARVTATAERIANGLYKQKKDGELTVREILDCLRCYYRVARTRFVDNVCLQVVERHFLGAEGSVRAFTPELVVGLGDAVLEDIAGEDWAVRQTRKEVNGRMERLRKARSIATRGAA